MSKRIATILAPMDLDAAGTKVIDIKIKDAISRIEMFWRVTNVTVSAMLDAVTACISKIELVDGSEILASVSGAQLQAINFYDRKVMPLHKISLTVGGYFEAGLSLDFGRFLWDALYAFQPSRFANPQLKITWDEDACNTAAVVNQFSVHAYVDDASGVGNGGMLVNREIKSIAMAASTHDYTDLPVDRPLRKIIVRGLTDDVEPIALFSNFKLSIDNDKAIPFDIAALELEKLLENIYPRILEKYTLDAVATAKTIYAALAAIQHVNIAYDATAFVTASSKFALPTITGYKIALAASVDIKALTADISGKHPGSCFPIDFGEPNDPATWLPINLVGSHVLDVTMSASAGSDDTMSLVVQQLRK